MASYEKRENNTWSVRFRTYYNGVEKQTRLSGFKTKREAERAYARYINEHKYSFKNLPTFEEIFDSYFAHMQTRGVKYSSYSILYEKAKLYILPFFAKQKIESISVAELIEWQKTLDGKSYTYKKGINSLLRSIFLFGNRYFNTPNPTAKLEPLRNLEPKKEMQFWTTEEFYKFISVIPDDDDILRLFYKTLFFTGMRRGECQALTPKDIDSNYINVNKSFSYKMKISSWAITTPKNISSYRKIPITDEFYQELQDHIKKYKLTQTNLVFCGKTPIPQRSINRGIDYYSQLAGVKRIRVHDLRHSFASNLLSSGLSIVALSKVLGHSDTKELLNRYAHVMPNDDERVRNELIKWSQIGHKKINNNELQ